MDLQRRAPKGVPQEPLGLMYRVYKYILPEVRSELTRWTRLAETIPNEELRKQALSSIETKKFHCQGGAVYAALNMRDRHILIPLIVAFQTISDYLDNLCDRSTSLDPEDFRLLHQSMLDAVQPEVELSNYYALRDDQHDNGYLHALVNQCRECIKQMPSYNAVRDQLVPLVQLYTELQIYKHIRRDQREPKLLEWWMPYTSAYPDLAWNEFAAATGSTLGMFQLFAAALDEQTGVGDAERIRKAYFPYVNGLHILLDYLIDQEEDRIGGDLNFCNYYDNDETVILRIEQFANQAIDHVRQLEHYRFHRMVIEGLLGLYLSDPKVREQTEVLHVSKRLMKGSPLMRIFFWMNSHWIRKHM